MAPASLPEISAALPEILALALGATGHILKLTFGCL
jgi:hypothetical protein